MINLGVFINGYDGKPLFNVMWKIDDNNSKLVITLLGFIIFLITVLEGYVYNILQKDIRSLKLKICGKKKA